MEATMNTALNTTGQTMFAGLDNYLGTLGQDVVKRLRALMTKPSQRTWDDAHCIILRQRGPYGGGLTLWQAVISVDATFPRTGRVTDGRRTIKPWPRVPDAVLIARAIRYAREYTHNN
jgi:hypothetical protein